MRLVRSVPAAQEEVESIAAIGCGSSLMRCLKTCHGLWQEYMFDGPGRKPAKDFTLAERGKVKHVHVQLAQPLYKKVAELVRSGVSTAMAYDMV